MTSDWMHCSLCGKPTSPIDEKFLGDAIFCSEKCVDAYIDQAEQTFTKSELAFATSMQLNKIEELEAENAKLKAELDTANLAITQVKVLLEDLIFRAEIKGVGTKKIKIWMSNVASNHKIEAMMNVVEAAIKARDKKYSFITSDEEKVQSLNNLWHSILEMEELEELQKN